MEVEFSIFDLCLPVNTLAVIRRLEEILKEGKTNSILCLKGDLLVRAQACLLILWEQSKMSWNFVEEWGRVREELKPHILAHQLSSK